MSTLSRPDEVIQVPRRTEEFRDGDAAHKARGPRGEPSLSVRAAAAYSEVALGTNHAEHIRLKQHLPLSEQLSPNML